MLCPVVLSCFYTRNDLSAELFTYPVFPFFSSSNQMAAFLKTQNIFYGVFSLLSTAALMNSVPAAVFLKAPALLDLLCKEMFLVELVAAK